MHELLHKSEDSVVILEVSSHGINQGRVDGIPFDYALFTNFTLPLSGLHNAQNASLSFMTARRLGIEANQVIGDPSKRKDKIFITRLQTIVEPNKT